MGKRKGKSNHRKKGGFSGNDAGGNRNKKEKEMAKKEYYCNKRATSFGPDPSEDDQLARQLEALGGLCVKEVEGDSNCCFRSLSDQVGILLVAAYILLKRIRITYVCTAIASSMASHRSIMRFGQMWLISWNKTKRILFPLWKTMKAGKTT